jgi:hypothetical protein
MARYTSLRAVRYAQIAVIPQGVNPSAGCPRRPLGFVGEVEDLADIFIAPAADFSFTKAVAPTQETNPRQARSELSGDARRQDRRARA